MENVCRLRLRLALHEVTWCMVVGCTQNLRRDGSSLMWHQPCQRCKYTTSVDIQKRAIRSYLHIYAESHASAVSLLESGEQRYIKAINNNNNFLPENCVRHSREIVPSFLLATDLSFQVVLRLGDISITLFVLQARAQMGTFSVYEII